MESFYWITFLKQCSSVYLWTYSFKYFYFRKLFKKMGNWWEKISPFKKSIFKWSWGRTAISNYYSSILIYDRCSCNSMFCYVKTKSDWFLWKKCYHIFTYFKKLRNYSEYKIVFSNKKLASKQLYITIIYVIF